MILSPIAVPGRREAPSTEYVIEAERRLAEEFQFFDDWSDRYETLIEIGRRLAPMADALKTERNRVRNCRGDTWFAGEIRDGVLYLSGASDTGVVAGLLAVLIEVYSGHPATYVFDHPLTVVDAVGLKERLSPHRLAAWREITGRLHRLVGRRQLNELA